MSLLQHPEPRLRRRLRFVVRGPVMLAAIAAACGASAAEPGATAVPIPPPAIGEPARAIPDPYKLNMLIRTTLIALNQANQTGNYSVLRDLGTPQFQTTNNDARLAEIFTGLRRRNLDLSPILFFDPKLVREPSTDAGGTVRVTGFIPTSPERVLFDMGFEPVGGQWRLSAIVIDMQRPPAAPIAQPPGKSGSPKESPNPKPAKAASPPKSR
ncbi:MAG: hypothetical protein KJZ80_20025 [Hyphomicrobiaceae bacterium]|nr:hypothetical protein [Hyphomicrobiaceae bacterium]